MNSELHSCSSLESSSTGGRLAAFWCVDFSGSYSDVWLVVAFCFLISLGAMLPRYAFYAVPAEAMSDKCHAWSVSSFHASVRQISNAGRERAHRSLLIEMALVTVIYDVLKIALLWHAEASGTPLVVDYYHNGDDTHRPRFRDWCNAHNYLVCFALIHTVESSIECLQTFYHRNLADSGSEKSDDGIAAVGGSRSVAPANVLEMASQLPSDELPIGMVAPGKVVLPMDGGYQQHSSLVSTTLKTANDANDTDIIEMTSANSSAKRRIILHSEIACACVFCFDLTLTLVILCVHYGYLFLALYTAAISISVGFGLGALFVCWSPCFSGLLQCVRYVICCNFCHKCCVKSKRVMSRPLAAANAATVSYGATHFEESESLPRIEHKSERRRRFLADITNAVMWCLFGYCVACVCVCLLWSLVGGPVPSSLLLDLSDPLTVFICVLPLCAFLIGAMSLLHAATRTCFG